MKRLLCLSLLAFGAVSWPLRAQVILQQDFSAGGPVTNYAGSPPGVGQFSSLGSDASPASDFEPVEADEQITVSFDGTERAEIVEGKLRFTLRSAYRKYVSPRAVDCCDGYFYDEIPSRATLLRQSLGSPAPKLLYVQFRLRVRLQTPVEPVAGSRVDLGLITLSAPSGQQLGNIGAEIYPMTGERLRFDAGDTLQFFSGEVLVTVILNHTGEARTYAGPNGVTETVGGANYDYWINQTNVLDEVPSLVSRPLGLFAITVQSGQAPNRAIGPLPDDPGPATLFTLDDFVIRQDLLAPDTAGDGLTDLVETYFGTNPNARNAPPWTAQRSGNQFTLAWPEADAAGKTVLIQWSPDLVTWLTNGQSLNGIPARTITVTTPAARRRQAALDATGRAAAFLRLNVSQP